MYKHVNFGLAVKSTADVDDVKLRHKSRDSRSDSSDFSSDSSPKFKRSSKVKFIKNIKPETFKRPSVTGGGQSRRVTTNVAGARGFCDFCS